MILRDYQQEALSKILWAKNSNLEGNDLVVLPTGAGKSVVIAHLAKELTEPILILQPSKEILEQNYNKLCQYVDPAQIGIFSASMNQKEVKFFTFATIQSIYTDKVSGMFKDFKLVIIDEAHLVNPKTAGMYMKFLDDIGNPKVVGFTATPYRMDSAYANLGKDQYGQQMFKITVATKLINRMQGHFWKRIMYAVNTHVLIDKGYLCPLEYLDYAVINQEEIPPNKSLSDFNLEAYEKLMAERKPKVETALEYAEQNSKSVLVFCSSVSQAEKLAEERPGAASVSAKTPQKERDRIINAFKDGEIKTVFNVGVLTTGFDHPALDCIVLLRPTKSIGLYYQMLGRGVRIAPGKTTCKVIDLSGTVKILGRVETIKLVKQVNEKGTLNWELLSETGSWHYKPLFSYKVTREKELAVDNADFAHLFNK